MVEGCFRGEEGGEGEETWECTIQVLIWEQVRKKTHQIAFT